MSVQGVRRHRFAAGIATAAAIALGVGTLGVQAAIAAPGANVGFISQAQPTVVTPSVVPESPTAPKNEHKLWFAGGVWWASMQHVGGTGFTIHRYDNRDAGTRTWTDTGVVIDSRNGTSADALYNATANKLFISSHRVIARNSDADLAGDNTSTLTRYTLSGGVWTRDAGWPIPIVQRDLPALAIAQESDGQIIATFVDRTRPYVVATGGSANVATAVTFGAKFLIQWSGVGHNLLGVDLALATKLTGDDISAITSYGAYTTIMWSNQNTANGYEGFYVARHRSADPYGTGNFYGSAAVISIPYCADNHISLVTDPRSGDVYAAVKTSNDLKALTNLVNPLVLNPTDPQLELLKLVPRAGGTALNSTNSGYIDATRKTVTTVADGGTRPVLSYDNTRRVLSMFFSAAGNGPVLLGGGAGIDDLGRVAGVIYRKDLSPTDLSVSASTPGVRGVETLYNVGSTGDTRLKRDGLNDASVSAGITDATSGTVVLATGSVVTSVVGATTTARKYWFNDLFRTPVSSFTSLPTNPSVLGIAFSDTSAGRPTTWAWNFGDGGSSTLRSPTHLFASAGTFAVSLTTTNAWGARSTVPVRLVVGHTPIVSYRTARVSAASLGLRFTDTSTGLPASVTWDFGDGSPLVSARPGTTVTHYYKVAKGYWVRHSAVNGLGTKTTRVSTLITAAPGAPARPGVVVAAGRKVLVSWKAPLANGLVVTRYLARCSTAGLAARYVIVRASFLSYYVTGLTLGHRYTCTVTAYNALGYGRASSPSLSFFPKA